MKNIEVESKYQINRYNYYKLEEYLNRYFRIINVIEQKNYYIDTFDLKLNKENITLKVRKYSDHRYELIMKYPLKDVENYIHKKYEVKIPIKKEEFEIIIRNSNLKSYIGKYLKNSIIDINKYSKLQVIGLLETKRTLFEINENIPPISLDINVYLENIDYEVELEGENIEIYNDYIIEIFNKLQLDIIRNTDSKRERFFKRLISK